MLPRFLIAGVMKSGTTFLYNLVKNHSDVKMLNRNLNYSFFDDDRIYIKGIQWYESLFDEFELFKNAHIGQVSADCAFNKGSIQRIYAHIPKVKLVFVLRHPIERTHSHYWFVYSGGNEIKKFENALKLEPQRIKKNYNNYKIHSYIEHSKYKNQFDEVYKYFDKENVLVVPFDSLIKDTLRTINEVFKFIGVEPVNNLKELNYKNVPKNKAKIPRHHLTVLISNFLQKIKMKRLGKILINLDRIEKRPPEMKKETRLLLEELLEDDIRFYENACTDFKKKLIKN